MKKVGWSSTLATLALLAFGAIAEAQQAKKVYRIGYLSSGFEVGPNEEAFRQGLRDLGYSEGQNLIIEWRKSKGRLDQLPDLAADLVRLRVDCILAVGVSSTRAAKQATGTIPIIMADADDDPVRQGIVVSLARPGGNVTGFISISSDLAGKRLELLKETLPRISRVAILYISSIAAKGHVRESEVAARALGLALQRLEVRGADDIKKAFQASRKQWPQAMIVVNVAGISNFQSQIVDLAIKEQLPTMSTQTRFVSAGGLMSYAADVFEIRRRTATYVDKIFNGTKPADLPVQQSMKFEFVINLKIAKQIGVTIPPNVLVRADRVIR